MPAGNRHIKRRGRPRPGSIPDVLDIFRCEVRFYREIAPTVGVRVPACFETADTDDGTLLVLEDLSEWDPGADPMAAAGMLAGLHRQWSGRALPRWPWLRRADAGADLVEGLYGDVWPGLAAGQHAHQLGRGDRGAGLVAWIGRLSAAAARLT